MALPKGELHSHGILVVLIVEVQIRAQGGGGQAEGPGFPIHRGGHRRVESGGGGAGQLILPDAGVAVGVQKVGHGLNRPFGLAVVLINPVAVVVEEHGVAVPGGDGLPVLPLVEQGGGVEHQHGGLPPALQEEGQGQHVFRRHLGGGGGVGQLGAGVPQHAAVVLGQIGLGGAVHAGVPGVLVVAHPGQVHPVGGQGLHVAVKLPLLILRRGVPVGEGVHPQVVVFLLHPVHLRLELFPEGEVLRVDGAGQTVLQLAADQVQRPVPVDVVKHRLAVVAEFQVGVALVVLLVALKVAREGVAAPLPLQLGHIAVEGAQSDIQGAVPVQINGAGGRPVGDLLRQGNRLLRSEPAASLALIEGQSAAGGAHQQIGNPVAVQVGGLREGLHLPHTGVQQQLGSLKAQAAQAPEPVHLAVPRPGDHVGGAVAVHVRNGGGGVSAGHGEIGPRAVGQHHRGIHRKPLVIVQQLIAVELSVAAAAQQLVGPVPVHVAYGGIGPLGVAAVVAEIADGVLHPHLAEPVVVAHHMGAGGVDPLVLVQLVLQAGVALVHQIGDALRPQQPPIGVPYQGIGGNLSRLLRQLSKQARRVLPDGGDLLIVDLPGGGVGAEGSVHPLHGVAVLLHGVVGQQFPVKQPVGAVGGVGEGLLSLPAGRQGGGADGIAVGQHGVGEEHLPLPHVVEGVEGQLPRLGDGPGGGDGKAIAVVLRRQGLGILVAGIEGGKIPDQPLEPGEVFLHLRPGQLSGQPLQSRSPGNTQKFRRELVPEGIVQHQQTAIFHIVHQGLPDVRPVLLLQQLRVGDHQVAAGQVLSHTQFLGRHIGQGGILQMAQGILPAAGGPGVEYSGGQIRLLAEVQPLRRPGGGLPLLTAAGQAHRQQRRQRSGGQPSAHSLASHGSAPFPVKTHSKRLK